MRRLAILFQTNLLRTEDDMRTLRILLLLISAITLTGCGGGSGEAIIPGDKLTAEQEAAVELEDQAIEDEESQGQIKPSTKKK